MNDGTISLADEMGLGRDRVGPEMLVLVLDAARPFEAPLLVPLTGVDEIVLGRGPARDLADFNSAGRRRWPLSRMMRRRRRADSKEETERIAY